VIAGSTVSSPFNPSASEEKGSPSLSRIPSKRGTIEMIVNFAYDSILLNDSKERIDSIVRGGFASDVSRNETIER